MRPTAKPLFSSLALAASAVCVAVLLLLLAGDVRDSLLAQILGLDGPDLGDVPQRDIVQNSMQIFLVGKSGKDCTVRAEHFGSMVDHMYFTRSAQLAAELAYDWEQMTLVIPCEQLHGEESVLHVWYVVPESARHAGEYVYFVTETNRQ